jgi:hypothetical protein
MICIIRFEFFICPFYKVCIFPWHTKMALCIPEDQFEDSNWISYVEYVVAVDCPDIFTAAFRYIFSRGLLVNTSNVV